MRQHARRRQNAKCDWQIERRANLPKVGRPQAHRHARRGKRKARVADGGSHAIAAFADRRIGQTDHRHDGEPGRHIDFDRDGNRIDAKDGSRGHSREHERHLVGARGRPATARLKYSGMGEMLQILLFWRCVSVENSVYSQRRSAGVSSRAMHHEEHEGHEGKPDPCDERFEDSADLTGRLRRRGDL